MAEIFGLPLVIGDLPEGWTALEAVVVVKAATDESSDPIRYLGLTTDSIQICDAITLLKAGLSQLQQAAAEYAEEYRHARNEAESGNFEGQPSERSRREAWPEGRQPQQGQVRR